MKNGKTVIINTWALEDYDILSQYLTGYMT